MSVGFSYFFGPQKTPFVLDDNGVVDAVSTTPFHGIISLGLLDKLKENDMPNEIWTGNAHFLEKNDCTSRPDSPELSILEKYASECKMLLFGQSAVSVKRYMQYYFDRMDVQDCVQCEIWNTKEGHTSSVWKVTLVCKESTESFAVNVARDEKAGVALRKSSEKMRLIGRKCPGINIAGVLDVKVLRDPALPSRVLVTRNEWIDDSYEIHSRKNKQTGEDELLMVERFLTSQEHPARITSILGRIFSAVESNQIKKDIGLFLSKAAACLQARPEVEINKGDVVWDGRRAVVVSIS